MASRSDSAAFSLFNHAQTDPASVAERVMSAQDRDMYYMRAWAIAKSPFMQLLSWGFYFYMSGSQLSVWSLFIVIPMVAGPIQMLASINTSTSAPVRPPPLPPVPFLLVGHRLCDGAQRSLRSLGRKVWTCCCPSWSTPRSRSLGLLWVSPRCISSACCPSRRPTGSDSSKDRHSSATPSVRTRSDEPALT